MDKHINSKQAANLEFWIAIGSIAVSFIATCIDDFPLRSVLFSHLLTLVLYLVLYFHLAPTVEKNSKTSAGPAFLILALITIATLTGAVPTYMATLLSVKLLLIYFNRNKKVPENLLMYDAILLFAIWMLAISCCWLLAANHAIRTYVFAVPLPMILVYLYAVHGLLPGIWNKKYRLLRYAGVMVVVVPLSIPVMLLMLYLFEQHHFHSGIQLPYTYQINEATISIGMAGNTISQLVIVIPCAWTVYKKRNEHTQAEIYTLKTELGKSDAHLHFLKSQINPHFLFNALNTLYGTALQENAERTGEGIQKLGDMMRLMLQENIQDIIPLTNDLEYLKNYIMLQELRTATSPDISIETRIEEVNQDLQITPMLLIPFVENAFKHGISLRHPSHIKITAQTKGETLYFDVHNSIHLKPDNDPEKGQSGIGLENVKQRLQLLYPGKHELMIRENGKEFFVHLTLQLTTNA